jgi:hypothetical protein
MVPAVVPIATLAPEAALAEYDRLHAMWGQDPALGDDRTPEGQEFLARLEALILRSKGLTPEENKVIGTAHGWRLKPPDAELPDEYAENPEHGVVADRPEQDAVRSVARNLEGGPEVYRDFMNQAVHLRATAPALDDVTRHQEYTAKWPTLAERQAIDERLDNLHAALDRLLAEQGIRPAQRERWLDELVRIEDLGVKGIEYLLGPFQQSLWDRMPAFADAYATVQGEAYDTEQQRLAQAEQARQAEQAEADEAAAARMAGVALAHRRWGKTA